MMNLTTAILLPVFAAGLFIFLIVRLRLFIDEDVSGRFAFLTGGVLLVLAAVWQGIRSTEAYSGWFLDSAYPYIDLAYFIVLLIGLALFVAGLALYADYWQMRKEDVEARDQKLSILDNLQRDARGPYQLLELLNITIKEIVSHLPDCGGAVFLLNRQRRQFVLTASIGLSRDETAMLEYYPLQRNVVSQSIDVAEPMLGGRFSMIDREGREQPSRFNATLVLPLVSGNEKIGGILLLSRQEQFFGRSDIRYLQPVAEWIAEKIKSARLERELSTQTELVESLTAERSRLTTRLREATTAFSDGDVIAGFCRSMVGLATGETVHLFGLVNGSLHIYGGSEPLGELSESYRTALVDALDRKKPLIINQEGQTDEGRTFVARSSLIYPLGGKRRTAAILLRRDDSPFKVDDQQLKLLELFAGFARLVLHQVDTDRLDLTRRTGFETILRLLRFDQDVQLEDAPDYFLRHLAPILPDSAPALMFLRRQDGACEIRGQVNAGDEDIDDIMILPGEGVIGEVANQAECRYFHNRPAVTRAFDSFETVNRDRLLRLLGEHGVPSFMAVCPVQRIDRVAAVAVFTSYTITESDRGEWERMLKLAVSLYSIRLTIADLRSRATDRAEPSVDHDLLGQTVNELNNHLSAVIGNAELAFSRTDLNGDVEQHLRSIIAEAEQAARFLKDSLGKLSAPSLAGAVAAPKDKSLGELIRAVLRRIRVAENLYMAGGRAREIFLTLDADDPVPVADEKVLGLVEETFNRFGSAASDDDVLTASTYRRGDQVYLDVSRHRKNFPPVEEVVGFGMYNDPDEVLKYRPSDTFLRYLQDTGAAYAYDRMSQPPSFLSFRFPLAAVDTGEEPAERKEVRVLAIDDQTVILDLISAMCQSLGYEVVTASSGSEGIALARKHQFTIVLTDLAMPGMSGLEAAAEIRKIQPSVPVVLVTGWEVNTDPAQLEAAGITEVLYKPFRIEQLTDIIRSAAQSSP